MRVLERIVNVELLFYAIAVAFTFTRIAKRKILQPVLFTLALALVIADNYVPAVHTDRVLMSESIKRVAHITAEFKKGRVDSILSYEPDTLLDKPQFYHLDAMLAAQLMHVKTLNGYSATSPADYTPYWMHPDQKTRMQWIRGRQVDPATVQVIR
jgi:hypothetical protein